MNIKYNITISDKIENIGDLKEQYAPLQIMDADGFNTDKINISNRSHLDLELQNSYDDTTNIIWSDGDSDLRIVNSGFAKLEDNQFKVTHNDNFNKYSNDTVTGTTKLIYTSTHPSKIKLQDILSTGNLMGGNYTFYLRYADATENKTSYISESGIISIFNGDSIKTVHGTLEDERTNKAIVLNLEDIDITYDKIFISFIRDTSDTNGVLKTKAYNIVEPYTISATTNSSNLYEMVITITGNEDVEEISTDELTTQYNIYNSAKTIAQSQNMLFLGNVTESNYYDNEIKQLLTNVNNIKCWYFQTSISTITMQASSLEYDEYGINNIQDWRSTEDLGEYYSPNNIYNYLGYWPEDVYRFGIVFIYENGSRSSVYNMPGYNLEGKYSEDKINDNIKQDSFYNTKGVFKMPKVKVFGGDFSANGDNFVKPIGLKFKLSIYLIDELKKRGIVNYIIVRQKRNPISLAQGIVIPTSKYGYMPLLYDSGWSRITGVAIRESSFGPYWKLLISSKILGDTFVSAFNNEINVGGTTLCPFASVDFSLPVDYSGYTRYIDYRNMYNIIRFNGLLCLDVAVSPQLQNLFSGNNFKLQTYTGVNSTWTRVKDCGGWHHRFMSYCKYSGKYSDDRYIKDLNADNFNLLYIPTDTPLKYINGAGFSTRAGSAEDAKTYSCLFKPNDTTINIISPNRGIYMPFIGVYNNDNTDIISYSSADELFSNTKEWKSPLVTIQLKTSDDTILSNCINDKSPFYAASDINKINIDNIEVFRGDCFVNTVSIRYNNNFADPSYPLNESVVGTNYPKWGTDLSSYDKWNEVDRGSLNALKTGRWITYKCMSNYNLNLRSEDYSYPEEISKMGLARSFYPLREASQASSNKVPESFILNSGYSSTLPKMKYFEFDDSIPNVKTSFQNRISFSNVSVDGAYENGYKIFQGLSYKDITNQYGSITKLISLGNNLFCVFEHGCAIVPVNEKALMQTQEGSNIGIYGGNVIPELITIVSPDYGSTFKDSIIKTPNGIYGVDTSTKKIWRYNESEGFTLLSTMKIQSYLNDYLQFKDEVPSVGLCNVVTHYNSYKSDVLFTFYNTNGYTSNICYNELLNLFVCKYTWMPEISVNVDNSYYSFDINSFKIFNKIWEQTSATDSYYLSDENDDRSYSWKESKTEDLKLFLKGDDLYRCNITELKVNNNILDPTEWSKYCEIGINSFGQYYIYIKKEFPHLYFDITVRFNEEIEKTFTILKEYEGLDEIDKQKYIEMFDSYLYRHNRNEGILPPTNWYNKQEPFEFEFIVSNPTGIHKIFDNLAIISNNVEPQSLEFEIIGDAYNFTKENIFKNYSLDEDNKLEVNADFPKLIVTEDQKSYNTKVVWDHRLNQYSLLTHQDCLNINEYGRRIGNIQYLEDKWNIVIQPIYYSDADKNLNSVRIRDKYIKIRVKYSGDKYVIITALSTLMRLSYA